MNVVDSSAWIEYFEDGPNADLFAPAIEATAALVVPALALYEVYKYTARVHGESTGLRSLGVMLSATVQDLTATLAVDAARISIGSGLAMADAIILATARAHAATLWTQDVHFEPFDNVRYAPKR